MAAERQFLKDLAAIRPGLPAQALRDIIGSLWRDPSPYEGGDVLCLSKSHSFKAVIGNDGVVGRVEFGRIWVDPAFSSDPDILGLHCGMSVEEACRVQPGLTIHPGNRPMPTFGIAKLDDHTHLRVQFLFDQLRVIEIYDGRAVYPAKIERPISPEDFPSPNRAYNIEILNEGTNQRADECHGWVFGLPPGISAAQWPLDPNTGYPLMHGFTLLLPEDYRCHGPDIVAMSFFATPADQNDGGAEPNPDLRSAVLGEGEMPADPDLKAFWKTARSGHPRLHRMQDILEYEFAILLLTRAEFEGPLCIPPRQPANQWLALNEPPSWLECGSGHAYFTSSGNLAAKYWHAVLGDIPERKLDWNRAIRWSPRAEDPNAGKAPEDDYGRGTAKSGYIKLYYSEGDNYLRHSWAKDHKPNHIGGTMNPIQGIPKFSPFYIGFDEYFGGYNFGTGNAQLDFFNMKLDWACG